MLKMNDFKRCIKQRQLIKINPSKEMIQKEIDSLGYDLKRAKNSMEEGDFKWSAVQSYYSMFHAAKALVLKKDIVRKVIFA